MTENAHCAEVNLPTRPRIRDRGHGPPVFNFLDNDGSRYLPASIGVGDYAAKRLPEPSAFPVSYRWQFKDLAARSASSQGLAQALLKLCAIGSADA